MNRGRVFERAIYATVPLLVVGAAAALLDRRTVALAFLAPAFVSASTALAAAVR